MRLPMKPIECSYCGELLQQKNGVVPHHDFPKPCRMLCRGSGNPPREANEPLWKDVDAVLSRAREWADAMRCDAEAPFAGERAVALFKAVEALDRPKGEP